jgi:crotonobetainyl-CoA:carnitine CoA-transferase CaiB-like acyl-CoA transferase
MIGNQTLGLRPILQRLSSGCHSPQYRHAQFLVQLVRRSLGARDERLRQGCRLTHGDQRAAEHVAFSTSHEIAAAAQRTQDGVTRRDVACVEFLDEVFAARDYKEWCEILEKAKGVWAPFEVHSDPQVKANGYLADVEMANGSQLTLVTSPAQFDEEPAQPTRSPEQGEHTEAVLLKLGLSWDEIAKLKERAVIG